METEQYAQESINEEGVYRCWPLAWAIERADSGAVAVAIRFAIHQRWHGKEQGWSQDYPIGWYVDARTWIVKKDGSINQNAVASLAKAGLWDGDWDKFEDPTPPNIYVHVTVEAETYEGKTRFRGAWINPDADEPAARGGFAPTDTELLRSLRQRFAGQTKAVAGGKPAGRAPAPPVQPAAQQPAAERAQPAERHTAAPGRPAGPPAGGRPEPRPALHQREPGEDDDEPRNARKPPF